MKKLIHVIEGTTLNIEIEGGERVTTFAADIVDDYAYMTAEELHDLMVKCTPDGKLPRTVADVQRMMDAGSNTFVVEHVGNQALMHFIHEEDAEVVGTVNKTVH